MKQRWVFPSATGLVLIRPTGADKQTRQDSEKLYQKDNGTVKIKAQHAIKLKDGARCKVIAGVHAGKSGIVRDINTSKTGHVTINVVQKGGERFKTLAKNVVI